MAALQLKHAFIEEKLDEYENPLFVVTCPDGTEATYRAHTREVTFQCDHGKETISVQVGSFVGGSFSVTVFSDTFVPTGREYL